MRKKIVSFLVVGIFVLSGLGAIAITDDTAYGTVIKEKSKMITIAFSSPIIEKSDNEYFEVHFEEASSYLMNPGQPIVPKVVKAVELPFGVKTKFELMGVNHYSMITAEDLIPVAFDVLINPQTEEDMILAKQIEGKLIENGIENYVITPGFEVKKELAEHVDKEWAEHGIPGVKMNLVERLMKTRP